ncbi:MAG: hypothetical protein KGQ36_01335 [Rickettsiales bacterium]|nr:hypothetical protein [Rickettsiales bacterium]
MTAPAGKTWGYVYFASYGSPNSCVIDSSCNAGSSVSIVTAACIGKSTCSINARNRVFAPDPCPGSQKRLQVRLVWH